MSGATTRTFVLRLCAPIPVGHDVLVQFFEKDTGVFSTSFELDGDQPAILDRTTGIAYGAPWHPASFFGWDKPIEPQYSTVRAAERIEGVVRASALLSETHASRATGIAITVLVVETAGAYR